MASVKLQQDSVVPDSIKFGTPVCPQLIKKNQDIVQVCLAKTAPITEEKFFQLENLATLVTPNCRGCICQKCPLPGSRYSFNEQWQLDLIQKSLRHDSGAKKWTVVLPWIKPRNTLPNNCKTAEKTLCSTERSLKKIPGGGEVYREQVHDMVRRNAAVLVTPEEDNDWKGVVHYIPHLIAL